MSLEIKYRDCAIYSLAAQQNAYELFGKMRLVYSLDTDEGEQPIYKNLTVKLESDGNFIKPESWEISQISPGQSLSLQERRIHIKHETLLQLTDPVEVQFKLSITSSDHAENILYEVTDLITILPFNFWGGYSRQPELLAAFVKPNGVYVESLVKSVTELLEKSGYGRTADGYQSNDREKPYQMVAALWNIIGAQKIAYVSPPPSYVYQGQMIRMASAISNRRMGACLDLSVLFASCLECMGLNTVIALTQDHAFVGVWLIDKMFPLLTNDEPMELRKRVDSYDLVFFETTMVTNSVLPTFRQACDHARSLIAEEVSDEFVYAIDIAQARSNKISPLATHEERAEETIADQVNQVLAQPPVLPPVRLEEQVIDETPETRIQVWQRKLLDLTKRNSLLSFKERSAGVRIFCPDIGRMEDLLSERKTFSFNSSEQTPFNDRSNETFRLITGNSLHEEYAKEQLELDRLTSNVGKKKLENTLVSLMRGAKNDLEEGGANTLFIALGMLSWKESEESSQSYKAPLILLPVKLTRKSANSPVKLTQLMGEDPLFNLTLIEFLQVQYEINLGIFREKLPEDSAGLDVEGIWKIVREAISEQPGFEVVPECVVARFSFAKYLMWKDLKDRTSELQNNPFVDHLIERPKESYQQDYYFMNPEEVDDKIKPTELFAPLNCDSSQLVAIEASGRPQDFVLEGPPGTGKSETIANMIAHNLALGRKVLFVAEKIAALNVVYDRLKKVGLEHLALELHSNKANKKEVLNQLKVASNKREVEDSANWLKDAKKLERDKRKINSIVKDLHELSIYKVSARQAIAITAKHETPFQLDWKGALADCPVKDAKHLEKLKDLSERAGIAYQDISDLDINQFTPVTAISWSHAWQTSLLGNAYSLTEQIDLIYPQITTLLSHFLITLSTPTVKDLESCDAIAELFSMTQQECIGFAHGKGIPAKLERLKALAEKKGELDQVLTIISHLVTPEKLLASPMEEWLSWVAESNTSWVKRLFVKGKINKEAKKIGFQKFKDLSILTEISDAKHLASEIVSLSSEFTQDDIWADWRTPPELLHAKYNRGCKINALIKSVVRLADDPGEVLTAIKTKFIDGRDFLDESRLATDVYSYEKTRSRLKVVLQESEETSINFFTNDLIQSGVSEKLKYIIKHDTKLKPWVEWNKVKLECQKEHLSTLIQALEHGSLSYNDTKTNFFTAFCRWLAPRMIDDKEELRTFKSSLHNKRLQSFRELDQKVAETTSKYISALHAQKMPDIRSKENATHFKTLTHEFGKKMRHKAIRVLFEETGERLLELCPCLMMSPLSVAQFLPTDFNAFDVVIFDEASQITTWDAVGAIARGKNVIVVGDPKQMPPSNYFNSSANGDGENEEDLESVLDQALVAGLPHKRLMGHYRSKHESLIAFSNSKYYENSLITYPSSDTKSSAVSLKRVNGLYAKGKGRNNVIEAQAVVNEVLRRLSDPHLAQDSIGIVTLNSDQQKTILDLLDKARREHPEIEPYFQDTDERGALFVKNLESVQGDERAVILLSLTYGPTELEANAMSMNFGPLNKQGGERRLNVAITRATTEVVVFASFDSSMIDLSRTSATAVEHLKHYLEYAERGVSALAEQSIADHGIDHFDSDFEEAVAWDLREKGWKVQTQVGVSKFRIDLGVIHPDSPGKYLAGVECDGATYHSLPSARDRDRTRQLVLEGLGWSLIRIWSTDYFHDSKAVIENVDKQLKELLLKTHIQEEMGLNEEHEISVATKSRIDKVTNTSELSVKEIASEKKELNNLTSDEIQQSVIKALQDCPNQSCTENSLISKVLKQLEIVTRGKPREAFQACLNKNVDVLIRKDIIRRYTATNTRLKLITQTE